MLLLPAIRHARVVALVARRALQSGVQRGTRVWNGLGLLLLLLEAICQAPAVPTLHSGSQNRALECQLLHVLPQR